MATLKELREQSRRLDLEAQDREARRQAQEALYESDLLPVMVEAARYFSELVDHLEKVRPEIFASYSIGPGDAEEVVFEQGDYFLALDNHERPKNLQLSTQCTLSAPVSFYVEGLQAADRYESFLKDYACPFYRRNRYDEKFRAVVGAGFEIEGPMQAGFRILPDPAAEKIHIDLRNLEEHAEYRYSLSPDRVDDVLFDNLSQVLLRERGQLIKREVSDSVRRQLQAQVIQREKAREQALRAGLAEQELRKREEEQARMSKRLAEKARTIAGNAAEKLRQHQLKQRLLDRPLKDLKARIRNDSTGDSRQGD